VRPGHSRIVEVQGSGARACKIGAVKPAYRRLALALRGRAVGRPSGSWREIPSAPSLHPGLPGLEAAIPPPGRVTSHPGTWVMWRRRGRFERHRGLSGGGRRSDLAYGAHDGTLADSAGLAGFGRWCLRGRCRRRERQPRRRHRRRLNARYKRRRLRHWQSVEPKQRPTVPVTYLSLRVRRLNESLQVPSYSRKLTRGLGLLVYNDKKTGHT
jgi:hypothetical protein